MVVYFHQKTSLTVEQSLATMNYFRRRVDPQFTASSFGCMRGATWPSAKITWRLGARFLPWSVCPFVRLSVGPFLCARMLSSVESALESLSQKLRLIRL